jgi:hypothetical protein
MYRFYYGSPAYCLYGLEGTDESSRIIGSSRMNESRPKSHRSVIGPSLSLLSLSRETRSTTVL